MVKFCRRFLAMLGRKLVHSRSSSIGKIKHMSAFHREKVLSVRHWTDTLFSFTATRNSGFRFLNGQFAMIGLEIDGRPLMRAYSMASANHEDELEFFSIKVADGPLTSRLQQIKQGDTILVGRKATGTLISDNLISGKRLLLLSTGTGLAPFASLIKDPEVYERFESIVLVHGCRQVSELAYGEELVAKLREDELLGSLLAGKLVYYPTVTREPFRNRGRITDLITSEQLFNDIGQPPLDIDQDRIMMCGSPAMLDELRQMFEARLPRGQPQRARSFCDREGVRRTLDHSAPSAVIAQQAVRPSAGSADAGLTGAK
jgi:ferredoxin/flavodoxin---NADP+ reductase